MIPPEIKIPDRELYQPRFSPWLSGRGFGELLEKVKPHTLVSEASCYTLFTLARQAAHLDGEFWECGVLRGGSAMLLAEAQVRGLSAARGKTARLRLFDTFDAAPATFDPRYDVPYPKRDQCRPDDLPEVTVEKIRERLAGYEGVRLHAGLLPDTFAGLESSEIALAHVDVNFYQSVWACCAFIYDRLLPGGVMVFDDYGYASCPGTRRAVDAFFDDRPEVPLILPTAQALVIKLPESH